MVNGIVVGLVVDNCDPGGMHRVLVEYPVDSDDQLKSAWCRMVTPMAGADRGLVMLPENGTEVVLGFGSRALSPYILGCVYNGGDDKPDPYKNDDNNNDKRVFWSRGGHLLIFDDTSGSEKVEFGAKATSRLDVTSAPVYQSLDATAAKITMYAKGDTTVEAKNTISFKCTDFKAEASASAKMTGSSATAEGSSSGTVSAGGVLTLKGGMVAINSAAPAGPASSASSIPKPLHPPT